VDGHLADDDRAAHGHAEHAGQQLRAEGAPLDHPPLGKHRLDRLEPEHLDAFYSWLATQNLKPNTVLQIHRILSRALKIAWKRGKTGRNVAAMVDAPVGEEIEIEPLTQSEARQILATAKNRPGEAPSVALALGIRQSEALGLRWQYVDLDAGTIEVGWQLKRAHYGHGCSDPAACATGRHRRPCPPKCRKHRHLNGCAADCRKRGHRCPEVKRPCRDGCINHARECPQRTGGGWSFARRKGVKPGRGKATLILALPRPSSPKQGPMGMTAMRLRVRGTKCFAYEHE
jgi:integrase